MDVRYRYGHRPGRRRRTRVLIVMVVSLLIIGGVGSFIAYDLKKSENKPVEGQGRTVAQALDENINVKNIEEPAFSMELPGDWKETGRRKDATEQSITWQATKKGEDNRTLKLYIDTIPTSRAINRLLPVTAQGNTLSVGNVSDNCATFTKGGTLDAGRAEKLPDTPAKWEKVDFICSLSRVTDNEIGTGSTEGINTVTVKGAKGEHKYFFVYTDRNIQANNMIFYNAVSSFTAK